MFGCFRAHSARLGSHLPPEDRRAACIARHSPGGERANSRQGRDSRNLIWLFKLPDKIVFDADRCDGSHLKVGDKIRGSYLKGTIDGNNVHVVSVGVITE